MSDIGYEAPRQHWQIGAYCFGRYTRAQMATSGRWECSAHGRGSGGHRSPVGAFLALRRWLKEPARPADVSDENGGDSADN